MGSATASRGSARPARVLPGADSIVTHTSSFIEPDKFVDAGQKLALISEAAYYRAERRGFDPGHELDDWLEAEREIESALQKGETPQLP
jgi:membrane-bound lytic murein transglycosylase MltF